MIWTYRVTRVVKNQRTKFREKTETGKGHIDVPTGRGMGEAYRRVARMYPKAQGWEIEKIEPLER